MFTHLKNRFVHHVPLRLPELGSPRRSISSAEIATALRPFYFVVHPDLFGRHPKQRSINEESLKHLSAHLEAVQQQRSHPSSPNTLSFYVRQTATTTATTTETTTSAANFKLIRVSLDRRQRDTKTIIRNLLRSCELSTEFVDTIKTVAPAPATGNSSSQRPDRSTWSEEQFRRAAEDFGAAREEPEQEIRKVKHEKTLKRWLNTNLETAHARCLATDGIRADIAQLERTIAQRLQLHAIKYDCGWNVEHYRGCLKSLDRMAEMYPADLRILRGRTVMFAPCSGVNLEGQVMLFTGDVHRAWLEFIRNVDAQDEALARIPSYESALSHVLLGICIARRKFMPKAQVTSYADQLRRVTTSMLDYLAVRAYPDGWPASLAEFELVVESEAGPLMVSPTGQFITPSTCSGAALVDFLGEHMDEARQNIEAYSTNKHIERDLHDRCLAELQLQALSKDDSIDPRRMIECLQRLLLSGGTADGLPFANTHLHITNYYSVLADGTVCIPWDWVE